MKYCLSPPKQIPSYAPDITYVLILWFLSENAMHTRVKHVGVCMGYERKLFDKILSDRKQNI